VVLRAYKDANHNRAAAARALGMSYKGFLNHLHKAQGKKKSPVPPALRRIYAVSLARAREVRATKAAERRAGAGAAVKGKGAARPPPTSSGLQHALAPLPKIRHSFSQCCTVHKLRNLLTAIRSGCTTSSELNIMPSSSLKRGAAMRRAYSAFFRK
jgi:hypothetical protein